MLITNKGEMVRTRVKEICETGRNTMGVKLMDLRDDEKLQAIAPVVSQTEKKKPRAQKRPSKNPERTVTVATGAVDGCSSSAVQSEGSAHRGPACDSRHRDPSRPISNRRPCASLLSSAKREAAGLPSRPWFDASWSSWSPARRHTKPASDPPPIMPRSVSFLFS
jgi:hypothetical protein